MDIDGPSFASRIEWRAWLEEKHDKCEEYVIIYSKDKKVKSISYRESLEEALCFGWIDGKIKRIDDTYYSRRFTPRLSTSKWSSTNIALAEKLMEKKLVRAPGMQAINDAKARGEWSKKNEDEVPSDLAAQLKKSDDAWAFFESLAPGYRRNFIRFVTQAKREQTRTKRIGKVFEMCMSKKKPTM